MNLGIQLPCGAGDQACPKPEFEESVARRHHKPARLALLSAYVHSLFFHLVFTKALGSRRVGGQLPALLPVSSGRQHGLPETQMPNTAAMLKLRQKA